MYITPLIVWNFIEIHLFTHSYIGTLLGKRGMPQNSRSTCRPSAVFRLALIPAPIPTERLNNTTCYNGDSTSRPIFQLQCFTGEYHSKNAASDLHFHQLTRFCWKQNIPVSVSRKKYQQNIWSSCWRTKIRRENFKQPLNQVPQILL